MDSKKVIEIIQAMAAVIEEQKSFLSELDAAIGDGADKDLMERQTIEPSSVHLVARTVAAESVG